MVQLNSNARKIDGYDSRHLVTSSPRQLSAQSANDPTSMLMKIQFVQGHTYDFCGVPLHVSQGPRDAGSQGRYYNDHIRDRYQC